MKNVSFIVILFLLGCGQQAPSVEDMASSRDTLQWQGVYHGVFPCPSCDGMDTTIELLPPNHYVIHTVRLGSDPHPYSGTGTFKWDNTGNIIILDRGHIYQVYPEHLYLLDVQFNRITGPDAERYRVDKITSQSQGKIDSPTQ